MTLVADPVMKPVAAQSSGRDGVVGQWTITNITAYRVTINKNGTGSFHTGVNFKRSCHENSFVYTDDSMGVTTQMTISRDRTHMTGTGTMGETMTAVSQFPIGSCKNRAVQHEDSGDQCSLQTRSGVNWQLQRKGVRRELAPLSGWQ